MQLVNTREEEFLAGRPRIPMRYHVRLGFTSDGLVTAKDIDLIADNGAYTGKAQAVLGAATVRHDTLFNYRAVRARSRLVYTNLVPTGAFRGFGNPSADWAVEQAWDLAATELGIEVARLVPAQRGRAGNVSPHNHKISSCELKQCISKAAKAIGWYDKRAARTPNRGLAMGWSVHVSARRSFGDYDGSSAIVRLTEDGRATSSSARARSAPAPVPPSRQIAAAELGLPVADVTVSRPDTDLTTHALGALASRVTYVAGNAVKRAAEQACERLLTAAARQLELPAPELWIEDGIVHGPARTEEATPVRLPVGVAVRAELYRPDGEPIVGLGSFDNPSEFPDQVRYGNESGAYNFVAEAAEVEVDPATGAVTVTELAAVVDCGTVINPPLAKGRWRVRSPRAWAGDHRALRLARRRADHARTSSTTSCRPPDHAEAAHRVRRLLRADRPVRRQGPRRDRPRPVPLDRGDAVSDAVGVRVKNCRSRPRRSSGACRRRRPGRRTRRTGPCPRTGHPRQRPQTGKTTKAADDDHPRPCSRARRTAPHPAGRAHPALPRRGARPARRRRRGCARRRRRPRPAPPRPPPDRRHRAGLRRRAAN